MDKRRRRRRPKHPGKGPPCPSPEQRAPSKVAAVLPFLLDEFATKAEELQEFLSPLPVGEAPHSLRVQALHAAALLQLSASEIRLRNWVSPMADPAQALVVAGGIFDLLLQQARALCLEEPEGLTMPVQPSQLTYSFAQATRRFLRVFLLVVLVAGSNKVLMTKEDEAALEKEPDTPEFRLQVLKLWTAIKQMSGESFPYTQEQEQVLALVLNPRS